MTQPRTTLARLTLLASLASLAIAAVAPSALAQVPSPPHMAQPALRAASRAAEAPESPSPVDSAVTEAPPRESPPVEASERPLVVIRTILGLVVLLGLSYVGGHARLERFERSLGVSQVITAGFPFVALGALARASGVLDADTVSLLGPLLRFGLGWIGFILGVRFNAQALEAAPRGVGAFVAIRAFVTCAFIVGGAVLLRLVARGPGEAVVSDPVFLRDALVLGTAGALTSHTVPSLLRARGSDEATVGAVSSALHLESLVGVVGLLFIASYFRPRGLVAAWHMPGTAWLLLTLGLGAAMGIVVYAIFRQGPARGPGAIVLTLGSVAFSAGMAGNLRLSSVVTCFLAGLFLGNAPGAYKPRLAETLERLERPIYLLFLAVVGAIWRPGAWREWALMGIFVAARLAGKFLGTYEGTFRSRVVLSDEARRALSVAPMGALPLAIVVSAMLLYPGESVSHLVTAILGGAIVTEVLVQSLARGARRPRVAGAPGPSAVGGA
jgi:hypothetical protein